MRESRRNDTLESGDQLVHLLGRHVELENFDGDEPLSLRVVPAIHGAESSSTNLMKHAKRSERIRSAVVPCAAVNSSGRQVHES